MNAKFKLNAAIYLSDQDRSVQQKNSEIEHKDNTSSAFNNKCVELSITKHQDVSAVVNFKKAKTRVSKVSHQLNDRQPDEKEYKEKLISDYLLVCKEDGGMTHVSLQQLAKAIGVENSENITQITELVRVIQKASQQRSCFQSDHSKLCKDKTCIWSNQCQKLIAEWMR